MTTATGAKLVRTVTITTNPKSSGVKSRAKMTAAVIWRTPYRMHRDRNNIRAKPHARVLSLLVFSK
jgi:hypothetical protein